MRPGCAIDHRPAQDWTLAHDVEPGPTVVQWRLERVHRPPLTAHTHYASIAAPRQNSDPATPTCTRAREPICRATQTCPPLSHTASVGCSFPAYQRNGSAWCVNTKADLVPGRARSPILEFSPAIADAVVGPSHGGTAAHTPLTPQPAPSLPPLLSSSPARAHPQLSASPSPSIFDHLVSCYSPTLRPSPRSHSTSSSRNINPGDPAHRGQLDQHDDDDNSDRARDTDGDTNGDHDYDYDDNLSRLSAIPTMDHQSPPHDDLQCCCGSVDCALLRKNSTILASVEKDVHTAAQLGQALLARHEAYMADAERDRIDLATRIERLEMDKQELEAENAVTIEENRALLDQLEALNNTVSDSDTKIKALEASLLSSQQTVRRLEAAAARALDAERHLALLEQEQEQLYHDLRLSKEDVRTHTQRFREAQRGILDMQDQLEKMEEEARQERVRHDEVIQRMERQREVEKQLESAAGRLKGAAASKTLHESKQSNPVVSHFVRDLLQDNANLQLGMAELRELLLNSNDEIQSLREQLLMHQPMDGSDNHHSLCAELEQFGPPQSPIKSPVKTPAATPRVSQELHIHHHYHVTPKATPKPDNRRLRRKRPALAPGPYSPSTSGTSTPNTSGQWRFSSPTAPPSLSLSTKDLSSSMTMPRQRWSMDGYSEFASSVPSSPRSNQRSSLFDPNMTESDVPTSPITSFDPMSPTWRASHRKGPSEISALSFKAPSLQLDPGTPPPTQQSHNLSVDHGTIHEVDEEAEEAEDHISRMHTPDLVAAVPSVDENSTIEGSDTSKDDYFPGPRIHRVVSHESIMSLAGGLDIHTLKARPSQLTLRRLGGAEAVVTDITAQPTLSRGSASKSAMALRNTYSNMPQPRTGARVISNPINRAASPNPSEGSTGSQKVGSLGKWAGWRPWGNAASSAPKLAPKPPDAEPEMEFFRAAGINQPGVIPGFQKYWAAQQRKGAPAKVTADAVDSAALQDGLQG